MRLLVARAMRAGANACHRCVHCCYVLLLWERGATSGNKFNERQNTPPVKLFTYRGAARKSDQTKDEELHVCWFVWREIDLQILLTMPIRQHHANHCHGVPPSQFLQILIARKKIKASCKGTKEPLASCSHFTRCFKDFS